MKKSEIQVGKIYHNSKGMQRKVIEAGNFPFGAGFYNANDQDAVRYERIINNRQEKGTSLWMTRKRFAAWAKGVVE